MGKTEATGKFPRDVYQLTIPGNFLTTSNNL